METRLTLRQSLIGFGAGTALLLSACDASSDSAGTGDGGFKDELPDPAAQRLIYEVSNVDLAVMESYPLQLRISASGTTRTGGWTEVQLVLNQEQSDFDTLVYDFVGTAPTGMATQAITPVEASIVFMPFDPEQITEVQVNAESGSQTVSTGAGE